MPSNYQQSQLIKLLIHRIKNGDHLSPSDYCSSDAVGSSEGDTKFLQELEQSWRTFKGLFVKELALKSKAKSAVIFAMETICSKDSFGFTGEELEKLDDFLVSFEDICLPTLILVYERFRFYSYKFCDPGLNKSNQDVISSMIALSSFCGVNYMPLTYLKHIITESIGIDDRLKEGLISFLGTTAGRSLLDDTGVRQQTNGHGTSFKDRSETSNDFADCDALNNNEKIVRSSSSSSPKFYEDDLLTCDKLVKDKSTVQESDRNLAAELVQDTSFVEHDSRTSFTKIPAQCLQNKCSVVTPLKLKLNKSAVDVNSPVRGKQFDKKNKKKHLKSDVSEGEYSCPKCSLRFQCKNMFTVHLKKHNHDDIGEPLGPSLGSDKKSTCEETKRGPMDFFKCGASNVCDERITKPKSHHRKLHSQIFQCEVCQTWFKGAAKLQRHSLTHTGEKPFTCHCCHTPFADRSHLNVHMRVHTGEKPFKCQWCAAEFSESTKLKNHVRTHTGEKPFVCEICGTMFSVLSTLKSHKKIHAEDKPFKCEFCNFTTAHPSNLKAHLKLHLGEKKFTCDKCGASFLETAKLKRHSMIHTGEQPYSCEVCGKRFADKSHLTVHLRIHSGDKPFKCTHAGCTHAFVESSKLKNHMRRHTGEKPYICEVCGTSFAVPYSLKSHMRRHTGEKPYKCKLCDYASSQSSNLKTHMTIHNGSRPHPCTKCGASFSELSKLKRHMVVHCEVGEGENFTPSTDPSKRNDAFMNGDISLNGSLAGNHHLDSYHFKQNPEQQRKPGGYPNVYSDTNPSGQELCESMTDFGQFGRDQSYSSRSSLHLYELVSQPLAGDVHTEISQHPHHSVQNLLARGGDYSMAAGGQQLVTGQHTRDIEVGVLYTALPYKNSNFQESSVNLELGHL